MNLMNQHRSGYQAGIILWAGLLLATATAWAQQNPHLAYVYPAGGKAGTSFPITVGGQSLITVSNVQITGPGITATVLDHYRPMNQKDFNDLRDRLKALQDKFQAARRPDAAIPVLGWVRSSHIEDTRIAPQIARLFPGRS